MHSNSNPTCSCTPRAMDLGLATEPGLGKYSRMPQCVLRGGFLALALLTLIGCGPIYDTQYQFTPPDDGNGRACIYQCENGREQCTELEELREESCENRAESEYQRCADNIYRRKGRDPKWNECYRESCSSDTERCENSYRSCYQSCGGKVRAETVCVANCDQIPPKPTQ